MEWNNCEQTSAHCILIVYCCPFLNFNLVDKKDAKPIGIFCGMHLTFGSHLISFIKKNNFIIGIYKIKCAIIFIFFSTLIKSSKLKMKWENNF